MSHLPCIVVPNYNPIVFEANKKDISGNKEEICLMNFIDTDNIYF